MTPPHDLRTALLLGDDHLELEDVAIREITPNLAIGISRGRFPKGYPHLDPNEDAVFATSNGDTTILAVADGHQGFDAARVAIAAIAKAEPYRQDGDAQSIIHRLAVTAIEAVAGNIPSLRPPRDASRTALTICVIRNGILATSTLGDTACLISTPRRSRRVGSPTAFLDRDTTPAVVQVDQARLVTGSVVMVASDGYMDFADQPNRLLRSNTKLQARDIVEVLMAAAFSGGAGDNITIGVSRFDG